MLARLFATRPVVMVLDEPTRGIDIASKVDLQRRIATLVDQGMAIVFISSEFSEVVRMSDRIVVLKDREKIGELSNGPGVTVDSIVEMIAAEGVTDDDELNRIAQRLDSYMNAQADFLDESGLAD